MYLGENSGSLLGGSAMIGILAYGLVSAFGTGPLVGERTIARSGWDRQCRALIAADYAAKAPAPRVAPELDCGSVFGLLGRDGLALCEHYGDRLRIPLLDQIQEQQRRVEEHRRERLAAAAERAGSRCACAANVLLEEGRISWAIAAGTARLVTPPSVKNLEASLVQAFHGPACAAHG